MRRAAAFASVVERAVLARGAAIVGVCNVTPDSFSDGGRFLDPAAAKARIEALLAEGADVIDVGGESTRPGAKPVPAAEQLERVLPVIRWARERAPISIDTQDPAVAAACLEAGAIAVNDVSCLRDPGLADVVAKAGAALILMHSRGNQESMIDFSVHPDDAYGDVVADVVAEWSRAAECARARGVSGEALVFDPGLGFAKNARHSQELLARTADLVGAVRVPVLVGASRKSFLKVVDPTAEPADRLGASVAAALHAVRAGAKLVRVHDVRATHQALALGRLLDAGKGEPRA